MRKLLLLVPVALIIVLVCVCSPALARDRKTLPCTPVRIEIPGNADGERGVWEDFGDISYAHAVNTRAFLRMRNAGVIHRDNQYPPGWQLDPVDWTTWIQEGDRVRLVCPDATFVDLVVGGFKVYPNTSESYVAVYSMLDSPQDRTVFVLETEESMDTVLFFFLWLN